MNGKVAQWKATRSVCATSLLGKLNDSVPGFHGISANIELVRQHKEGMFSWQYLSYFSALHYEAAGNLYKKGSCWCNTMSTSLPSLCLTLLPFPRGRRMKSPLSAHPLGVGSPCVPWQSSGSHLGWLWWSLRQIFRMLPGCGIIISKRVIYTGVNCPCVKLSVASNPGLFYFQLFYYCLSGVYCRLFHTEKKADKGYI